MRRAELFMFLVGILVGFFFGWALYGAVYG